MGSTTSALRLVSLVIAIPAACSVMMGVPAAAASVAAAIADAVPLYRDPSITSKEVASLSRGQRVVIEMSIRRAEAEWCRIVTRDQARTTGFVRCNQLERLRANPLAWRLALDAGHEARAQERYADAEVAFRTALDEAELFDTKDPKLGVSLNDLVKILVEQGKYREAEPLTQRTVAFMEEVAGKNSPALAHTLAWAAAFHNNSGKPDEAKRLLDRALAIQERALGPKHPDVATTLEDMTRWYRDAGRYGEAETAASRSLEVRERAFGPHHPAVAASLTNLAMVHRDRGKRMEARALLARALAIQGKTLGPESTDLAVTLTYLADIGTAEGQYRAAERDYRRALLIYRKTLGHEHAYVGMTTMSLATMFRAEGNHQAADELYRSGLAILEKRMGSRNPSLAGYLNEYVRFLKAINREAEAQPIEARIKDLESQGRRGELR
jgi:tetratricopeptide (TPR) repeat protein